MWSNPASWWYTSHSFRYLASFLNNIHPIRVSLYPWGGVTLGQHCWAVVVWERVARMRKSTVKMWVYMIYDGTSFHNEKVAYIGGGEGTTGFGWSIRVYEAERIGKKKGINDTRGGKIKQNRKKRDPAPIVWPKRADSRKCRAMKGLRKIRFLCIKSIKKMHT